MILARRINETTTRSKRNDRRTRCANARKADYGNWEFDMNAPIANNMFSSDLLIIRYSNGRVWFHRVTMKSKLLSANVPHRLRANSRLQRNDVVKCSLNCTHVSSTDGFSFGIFVPTSIRSRFVPLLFTADDFSVGRSPSIFFRNWNMITANDKPVTCK